MGFASWVLRKNLKEPSVVGDDFALRNLRLNRRTSNRQNSCGTSQLRELSLKKTLCSSSLVELPVGISEWFTSCCFLSHRSFRGDHGSELDVNSNTSSKIPENQPNNYKHDHFKPLQLETKCKTRCGFACMVHVHTLSTFAENGKAQDPVLPS